MDDKQRAIEALQSAWFTQVQGYLHNWRRERTGDGLVDKVSLYENFDQETGTFRATLSGDWKDLPALLNPLTMETVEVAVMRGLQEYLAGTFARGWCEGITATIMDRLRQQIEGGVNGG